MGVPLPHCVPVSTRGLGGCRSHRNDHVQGVECGKGAWFDSRFLWKQPRAGPHHLPRAPSHDDSDGGPRWLLPSGGGQAGFSTPGDELCVSLSGRILLLSILQECIFCVFSTFLLPFEDVLWGTAGNRSLFLLLLTGQIFQGACSPASGSC